MYPNKQNVKNKCNDFVKFT